MIAPHVETSSLKAQMILLANNRRTAPKLVIVKPLAIGEHQRHWLEGLAALIGGSVISDDAGSSIEGAGLNELGTARSVWIARNHTTLIGGGGSRRAIGDKVVKLRREIEKTTSQHEKDSLRQYLAVLSTGISVIHISGTTDHGIMERKTLAEGALAATKAACDEGIVPGAGTAFLLACNAIRSGDSGQSEGMQAMLRAAEEPLRRIVENAGGKPQVVVDLITRNNKDNYGYNAVTGEFGDMVEMGILDSTRTIQCALENAVSAASLIMNMAASTEYEGTMQELEVGN
jgi:chaperonin GroEL